MTYSADCLAMTPSLYWRLDETSGSTIADASGNGNTGKILGPFKRYQSWVLDLDPTLYLMLDSAGGVTDQSGSGLNGTAQGGITAGGYAGSPIVDETTATDFDGLNDYVSTTYDAFKSGGSVTVTGWANRDASASTDTLCGGGLSNPALFRLANGSQNVLFDPDNGTAGGSLTWTAAWPGNTQWVHFALALVDGSSASLYINGSLVSTQTLTQSFNVSHSSAFFIGNWAAAGDWFDGKMAHIAVFDRVLTAPEISSLYASGLSTDILGITYNEVAATTDTDRGALRLNGEGNYVRADAYSPFVADSQRSFVLFIKANHGEWAIKNIFGGSGTEVEGVSNDLKFPVLETAPLQTTGNNFRWYDDINAEFPTRYNDWGDVETPLGEWMHIVLTVDDSLKPSPTAVTLWVNGVNLGNPSVFGQYGGTLAKFPPEAGRFMFGVRFSGSGFLEFSPATYDEVAVFERILSDSEIRQLAAWRRIGSDFTSGSGYRDRVRGTGPSLYWPLTARYGTLDQSGNGYNAILGVNARDSGGVEGPIPNENSSTDFNGLNEGITTTAYVPFVAGTARSFAGWAWRANGMNQDALIGGGTTTPPYLYILQNSRNVLFDPDNSVAGGTVTWTSAWPGSRQWVHWALVFDEVGNTVRLYINGLLVSEQAVTQDFNASVNTFAVGQWGIPNLGAGTYFNGRMAHVAVFERALTGPEIYLLWIAPRDDPAIQTGVHAAGRGQ